MKKLIIDDIHEEFGDTTSQFTVDVDGVKMVGYNIAKPMNYDPEYSSKDERNEMAELVRSGKAIAVCFFQDLTPEEQSEYVKNKIKKKSVERSVDKITDNPLPIE